MPRYFFHLEDHVFTHDEEGTELPDLRAARLQAAELVGEILKHEASRFWDMGDWRLVVTDDQQNILFRIDFRGTTVRPNPPLQLTP